MQVLIGSLLALLAVNIVALIGIGLLTQENPLRMGILSSLFGFNVVMLLATALMTSSSVEGGLNALGAKMLPLFVLTVGLLAIFGVRRLFSS